MQSDNVQATARLERYADSQGSLGERLSPDARQCDHPRVTDHGGAEHAPDGAAWRRHSRMQRELYGSARAPWATGHPRVFCVV